MVGRYTLPQGPRNAWLAAMAVLCALVLGSCGNTLQDQPIGAAPLESVIVKSRFPVYWLGLKFQGMQITSVTIDPSEAVTIRYGDCVLGGQYTCVTPITIVSSPDNSFVAGRTSATHALQLKGATHALQLKGATHALQLRGVSASVAQGGATLAIPTGGVVVNVYASDSLLARAAATTMAPINEVGLPRAPLPAALPDTGFDRVPLPGQVPPGVSVPRPRGA